MKKDKTHKNGQKNSSEKKVSLQKNLSQGYETMSQQQNREGKGRKHAGSDGSSDAGEFSNH